MGCGSFASAMQATGSTSGSYGIGQVAGTNHDDFEGVLGRFKIQKSSLKMEEVIMGARTRACEVKVVLQTLGRRRQMDFFL